jgi:hypothetical protein
MSANNNQDKTTFLPLVAAAAGTVLIAGVFSAAAVALDEEDRERTTSQNIGIATDVISSNLMDGHSKRHGSNCSGDQTENKTSRFICWDRQRAKLCVMKDYLGSQPTFGPEDFKRVFQVSRHTYDQLRNNLCHVQPFFWCGFDAT